MTQLEVDYRKRYENSLKPIATRLQAFIEDILDNEPRIDRINARPKSVDRFLTKAHTNVDGSLKYQEPIHQIQDQIGARIITYYRCDVDRIADAVLRYFRAIESRDVVPESEWEFGYFGRHYVFLLPDEVVDPGIDRILVPRYFELQIKTLFQHAWSEANHDLGYKPQAGQLNKEQLRKLAFSSAQAWGADTMINELFLSTNPSPQE